MNESKRTPGPWMAAAKPSSVVGLGDPDLCHGAILLALANDLPLPKVMP